MRSSLSRESVRKCNFDGKENARVSANNRIRIRMEAYDARSLDASAQEIVEQAKRTSA
jgi:ribosomal protein S10